jgi:hypothetical protein
LGLDRKILHCGCILYFDSEEHTFGFTEYCGPHAEERRMDLEVNVNMLKPILQATDADLERVVTYLRNGRVATIEEISDALGVKQVTVALSLQMLLRGNLVNRTVGKDRYFLCI